MDDDSNQQHLQIIIFFFFCEYECSPRASIITSQTELKVFFLACKILLKIYHKILI